MPENTLLNFVEKRAILSRVIPHGPRKRKPTTNVDAHSHILNELEWTILLDSQFYFEELDLGLKKLHQGGESYKRIACKKRPKLGSIWRET